MSQYSIQSRKPAALSKPLHHELSVYALAASAAGVSVLSLSYPAEAEIVYIKVNQTIGRSQGFAIDLNHDGIIDFKIQNFYFVNTVSGFPYNRAFALRVKPEAGVQVGKYGRGAAALPAGAKVGPIQPAGYSPGWANMASQVGTSGLGTYDSGSWFRASDQYLGLAFSVDGEVHFGWARLTVRWNRRWAISANITGYAYETEANKPITAGDTGSADADGASSGPTSEMLSVPALKAKPVTLGALALGARGLTIRRRPEPESQASGN